MLNNLKKRSKKNEVHPHEWRLQEKPSKKHRSRSSTDPIVAPSKTVFRDIAIPYSLRKGCDAPPTIQAYPTPGHMASLLLLIECFEKLREDIEHSVMLRSKCSTNTNIWHFYALKAIKRFKLWITKIESVVRHSAVFNRYGTGSHLHGAFTENYMPPLDVLLIWLCYLQNSSAYARLLASNNYTLLAQISFPWHVLPTVIDQETLHYTFNDAAEALWKNLIEVPSKLEDCIDIDLDKADLAFTSSDQDLLDTVVQQTEIFQEIHRHHWLRSPAASNTLRRALSRYAETVVLESNGSDRRQQIPTYEEDESRNVSDLKLDAGQKLALQTHKAYHAAWKTFSQVHSLVEEDRPPPPVYRRSITRSLNSMEDIRETTQTNPKLENCFCWICERVKDEMEGENEMVDFTPLIPVSSPDAIDEKRSLSEASSSSSEDENELLLSRKQIKQIKREVTLYKHLETKREQVVRAQTL